MGTHMKTTVEISTPLLRRAQKMAAKEQTTLRALVEEGLTRALATREHSSKAPPPLVTFKGKGLAPEFQGASWEKIRDTIYDGRGA
jgi:hypothetical protein